jgi:hypothetical protein
VTAESEVIQVRTLDRLSTRRRPLSALALAVALVAAIGLVAAATVAPGNAAGARPTGALTLTFAGQVVGDEGIGPFVGDHPPIEGGAARVYTVPAGFRLVIDSVYADVYERWVPNQTYPRGGVMVGIDTSYKLGSCEYPGYQRSYGVALTAPVNQTGETESEARRTGDLSGPIFVEGGREVNGTAFAPHGDSELFVHVVVHGTLEAATNPVPPVCGAP